jgi:hypothetical protein
VDGEGCISNGDTTSLNKIRCNKECQATASLKDPPKSIMAELEVEAGSRRKLGKA